MLNIFMLLSFIITLIGLYFDPRITKKRYMLILSIFILMLILSIYFNKLPNELIKDLYGYSALMFSSFIFHALGMKGIYDYFENKGNSYISYLISRISFIFSISMLLYILSILHKLIYESRTRYKGKRDNNKYESSIEMEEHLIKKTEEIYEKYYTKKGIKLILLYGYLTIEYKIFSIINSNLTILLIIIQSCLGFFVNNFNNYSILLLGIKIEEEKKEGKDYLQKMFLIIIYFIITLLGAGILGIPSRLYFIGIIIFIGTFIKECLRLKEHPNKRTIKLVIKHFYYIIFKGEGWGINQSLGINQIKKFKGFDLVYGSKFNYNLEYFIFLKYTNTNLGTGQEDFKLSRILLDTPDLNNITQIPYPMISYLKYYSIEELAIGEYEGATTFNAEYEGGIEQKGGPIKGGITLIEICTKFNIPEKDGKKIYKNLPKVKNDAEMRKLCTLENLKNFKGIVKEQRFIYDATENSKT